MKQHASMGLGLAIALGASAQADVITVKNSLPSPHTLSDLIVWAEDGTQEVILQPGTNAAGAADDDEMAPDATRVFVTTKKVKKYFLSVKFGAGAGISECEWKFGGDVTIVGQTSSIWNPQSQQPLHCAVQLGAGVIAPPPLPGSVFNVTNGQSQSLPGWFIGTTPDFVNGEILVPFTGPMQILPGSLSVSVQHTPLPCPADLDGDGLVGGADLGMLLAAWGPAAPVQPADLNHDGIVDGADLGSLLAAWGPCP